MVQHVSKIEDNEQGKRPVLVTFQNSELQEGEESKLHTGIYRERRNKIIVGVATKNILYTGEINEKDDPDDLYNRYLLLSNRKTGKVKLIAVDTVTVTPQIASKPKEISDAPSNPNNSMSQLNKEFGSKKIKRLTEQRERLQMNIEDVKEHLENTVAGVELDESEALATNNVENDSMYRPPINRGASTREQVYKLDDILPEYVLNSLEEEANKVLSADLNEFELSSIVKEKLVDLQNSNEDVLVKTELLLYIDYLIKYITKPAKNITKKCIVCHSSIEVNSHILDNFSVTSNTGRTRPLSMRDKTICYILVLSMIAFDYQLNVENLAKNVKMGLKKLQEMGRILAFSSHAKDKSVMVLKVPLPPAVSSSPRKRKR